MFAPMKPEDKRRVACREAGTALAVLKLGTRRTLVCARIYPACKALGMTDYKASPVQRLAVQKDQLADLYIVLAGRAAEEVLCGPEIKFSTPNSETTSAMANALITRYGVKDSAEKILKDAYDLVKQWAEENRQAISAVADALVVRGELTAADVEAIANSSTQAGQC